jgi:hypothetical protein
MHDVKEIITLITAWLSLEDILFFRQHGCEVEEEQRHHRVTCPQGTRRQAISRLVNPWDELTFPDGTEIRVGLLPNGQSIFVTRI